MQDSWSNCTAKDGMMSCDVTYLICSPSEVLCCVQVTPTAEEAGHCDVVEVTEIGDTNIVVFKQGKCNGFMNSLFPFEG